jgi:hypothetical protein
LEFHELGKRHNARFERDRSHAALVAMVLANCNRNPKDTPQPYTIADFMPGGRKPGDSHKPTGVMTDEEMCAKARQINALFGGVERPPRKAG